MAGVRRSTAFGSMEARGKRWRASFPNPRFGLHPEEPKRVQRSFNLKTEGHTWLAGQKVAIDRDEWLSPREEELARIEAARLAVVREKTFADYAEDWFKFKEHKPSTARAYGMYYRNHLEPYWGTVPIRSITTELVTEWVKVHLSPGKDGARRKAYELFRSIMNDALLDEVIVVLPCNKRTNQLANRKMGQSARHKATALKPEHLQALVNAMPDHEKLFTLIMGIGGLRIGEARELRRHDLDLAAGTITIERAVSGDGKDRAVETPKTEKGQRTIHLAPAMIDLFHKHLEAQGKRPANALVFPSSIGADRYINESTYRTHLKKACESIGIPRISAHDLRHTAVTLAMQLDGISTRDVQDMVGHTTAHMTNHYAHTFDTQQQRIANGVTAAVFNAPALNVTPLRKAQ